MNELLLLHLDKYCYSVIYLDLLDYFCFILLLSTGLLYLFFT